MTPHNLSVDLKIGDEIVTKEEQILEGDIQIEDRKMPMHSLLYGFLKGLYLLFTSKVTVPVIGGTLPVDSTIFAPSFGIVVGTDTNGNLPTESQKACNKQLSSSIVEYSTSQTITAPVSEAGIHTFKITRRIRNLLPSAAQAISEVGFKSINVTTPTSEIMGISRDVITPAISVNAAQSIDMDFVFKSGQFDYKTGGMLLNFCKYLFLGMFDTLAKVEGVYERSGSSLLVGKTGESIPITIGCDIMAASGNVNYGILLGNETTNSVGLNETNFAHVSGAVPGAVVVEPLSITTESLTENIVSCKIARGFTANADMEFNRIYLVIKGDAANTNPVLIYKKSITGRSLKEGDSIDVELSFKINTYETTVLQVNDEAGFE